jgi:hypothetical protein
MKKTNVKANRELQLKRRLELVRSTVRVLTPMQLEAVRGGTEGSDTCNGEPWCPPLFSI